MYIAPGLFNFYRFAVDSSRFRDTIYTLLNVDRGVPEVWGITYDVRDLLNASVMLRDGRPLTDMKLGMKEKAAVYELLKSIHGTDIEKLLAEYHVIG